MTSRALQQQPFTGFNEESLRLVPLPEVFFEELMPQIGSLAELKTALYAFLVLDQYESAFRYLRLADFLDNPTFVSGMGGSLAGAAASLRQSLDSLVRRGMLLRADVPVQHGSEELAETLYFLNSPGGKAAVHAIERGDWRSSGDARRPVELRTGVPNIYTLYEQNIGPLTPMIADELREAESDYPPEWVEDAIRIAVENNVRNWRYARAILNRWKEKGRDERQNRRDTEKDRRRYAEWEDPG